jgi:hypothetical protein
MVNMGESFQVFLHRTRQIKAAFQFRLKKYISVKSFAKFRVDCRDYLAICFAWDARNMARGCYAIRIKAGACSFIKGIAFFR